MEKDWVFLDRRSDEYTAGLRAFISKSLLVAGFEGKLKCPCKECHNRFWTSPTDVEVHLLLNGMDVQYSHAPWTSHGELLPTSYMVDPPPPASNINDMFDDVFDMHGLSHGSPIHEQEDAAPHDLPPEVEKLYRLLEESKTELYPGSGKTKLDFILRLYHIKSINCWTDSSFQDLMDVIRDHIPDGHTLPSTFHNTKKLVTAMALPYEKIDVCPNDCMLFWKDHATDTSCTVCGASRYKPITGSRQTLGKRVSKKVLRYFPLGPRLQRLYMSRHTAESMVWHSDVRLDDGKLRHPADSPAWKHLDAVHPDFGSEPRNVRLGLASDGFNPFGMMSLSYSTWPVITTVYNLPPWLCMKEPYMMISLLIPGPTGPGKDIDIFLQPLVDELKSLWNEGIPTYDAFKKETFNMRAAVMWTINDFPAYAMLSGWSTKGKFACPKCGFRTKSRWLAHSHKLCYLGHRRWLPMDHRYRLFTQAFDGLIEMDTPPIPMTGSECLASLQGLSFTFGKGIRNSTFKRMMQFHVGKGRKKIGIKRKRGSKKYAGPWKKKSIFFDLPYWKDLLLRHNLNVMHCEKNFAESVLGTLLGTKGKTKDGLNSRLDLLNHYWKVKYHPKSVDGRWVYDPMPFNLMDSEKDLICQVLSSMRLPDGFASNLARCVREGRKLVGLKSHDLHVIMEYLLPVAIRNSLPRNATLVLLELSSFFRDLCTKVGTTELFEELEGRITRVLCELERMMPPSFFDIMVHLSIHLADEAKLAGPVHYRWMYPIERYLHTLKKYVRNKRYPEGSIAEGYIMDEVLGFCAMYFGDGTVTKRNRPGRNVDASGSSTRPGLSIFSKPGQSLGTKQHVHLEHFEWVRAHEAVLLACPEVEDYISMHEKLIMDNRRPRETLMAAQVRAHKEFPGWFATHIQSQVNAGVEIDADMQALANGPNHWIGVWKSYIMNGFRFHVKSLDADKISQNSGVFVRAETNNYSSVRDQNPTSSLLDYYGVVKDIYELDYHNGRKVVLFDCDWIDGRIRNRAIKKDDKGFTLVNFKHILPGPDTFILGSSAHQLFYVQDPKQQAWHVAVKTRPRDLFDMGTYTNDEVSAPQNLDNMGFADEEVIVRVDMPEIVAE